jgi:inosine-uridine nucleoside N-ribohydrolase
MSDTAKSEWNMFADVNTAKDDCSQILRLRKPVGRVDVVLDTDTYNEIDDQYALSYMIRSDEKLDVKAIYAAPFSNRKAATPAEGMEKSSEEIQNILWLNGREDLRQITWRGSTQYLPDEKTPVCSPAAKDLADRAMKYSSERPLYIITIGAITNIASAILLNPEIINRTVLVWLGGNAYNWPNNREFNLFQDVAAARIVFGCGIPLIQLPCMGVVSAFTTSGPELEAHLRGKNKLCDYLIDVTTREAMETYGGSTWSRAIWDVTAVGWLLDGDFESDTLVHAPIPEYDDRYAFDDTNHFIRYVYYIKRDNLLADLFKKLSK